MPKAGPKPLRYLSPIHKAGRQLGVYFERKMAGTDLSPQEGHLLSYLRSYAPCAVGDLVTVFGLRGSTATSVLDRLEERELIVRQPNREDRRSFLVELTARGRRIAERVQQDVDALEAAIAKRVTRAQEEGFRAVIDAVAEVTEVTLVTRKG
jgi:DNA-binding MarR family transcriptional regulator